MSQIRSLNNYDVCGEDKAAESKAELPVSAGPSSLGGPSASYYNTSAPSFTSTSSGYSFTRLMYFVSFLEETKCHPKDDLSHSLGKKYRDKKVSFVPITDIIIKLNGQNDCTVTRGAELVEDEVGFDVNLVQFNTKCIQIVDSDATQGIDFWKSSRKVLAAYTPMLTRLMGRRSRIVLL